MITQTLATTRECRNGNCPTLWATDNGTVIIQGYIAGHRRVRVPIEILERGVAQLAAVPRSAVLVPSPREGEPPVVRAGTDFLVRGDASTPDIAVLTFPENEAAVELAVIEVVRAVHRTKEAA